MKNSLIAGPLARALCASFNETSPGLVASAVHHGKFNLYLHARACTIKGKPSGGIYIWADCDPAAYDDYGRFRVVKRIRKGADLYRHAADVAERARSARSDGLVMMREHLYQLAESKDFDPDNLPRESSAYSDMGEEEILFWQDWLSKQPNKACGLEG